MHSKLKKWKPVTVWLFAVILLFIILFKPTWGKSDPEMLYYWLIPGYKFPNEDEFFTTPKDPISEIRRLSDVNHFSKKQNMTLLAAACHVDNFEAVRLLLERGADPNPPKGALPVINAAASASPKVLEAILNAGADPNRVEESGRSAIHMAVYSGHDWAVTMLLKHGADPTVLDSAGRTALEYAVEENKLNIVALLSGYDGLLPAHDREK